MHAHEYILQELTAATLTTSADDLQGLARIHSLLSDFAAAVPSDQTNASAVTGLSSNVTTLVEQMILNEVADADAALKQVCDTAVEIGELLKGKTPAPAVLTTTRPTVTEKPASPAADRPAEPAPIDEVDPKDRTLILEFINESGEHVQAAEAALLKLDHDPTDLEAINSLFRAFHTVKGVAGFIKLGQIGKLAHAVENLMDLARSSALKLNTDHIDVLLKSVDLIKLMTGAIETTLIQGTPPPQQAELLPLVEQLKLLADPNRPAPKSASRGPQPDNENPPADGKPSASKSDTPTAAEAGAAKQGQTADSVVKVSTDRLDSLINAIGELVIAQSMVGQDVAAIVPPNHRVLRTLTQVSKIARELQDLSMSMRMVPIQGVFQKMSRLARDLTRKSGKEFELEIVGGETELDRGLVEAISDPLVHMVRNSADHGIESPEDRERAGKPRAGRITLRAYHQAGNIVVEISDNGRGLNKAKILKKAIERGIVPAGKELSEQEIFKLIFAAGLSTADKVTDVSGRGVGMDVVLRNVESLRGRIDIASTEGVGSTFTIRLPLTLAVIDGLVVRVGGQRYVIPITSIEQSLRPTESQLSTVQNRGELCMVRDDIVPVVRLYELFGVEPRHKTLTEGLLVIVQDGPTRCCLLVDELLGQQQCVIKSLGDGVGTIRGVSGGAILGDGNVSLILDVPGLINSIAQT
jgi:two-component system, chemotaxis family, sensor kinase CheA